MNRVVAALSAVALCLAGWLYWKSAGTLPATGTVTQTATNEPALRQEIAELRQELQALREETGPAIPKPSARSNVPAPMVSGTAPEEIRRLMEEKDRELAAQGQALAELRARVADMERQLKETGERQDAELSRRDAEVAAKLEAASKAGADARAELESRNRRMQQLEADWRKQTDDARKQSARIKQLFDDLDMLSSRREAYMNNILGRYREATDLFRTMSLRIDNQRDGTAAAGNELSRIQNAVSLAEDDLRQLRALHTRAAQLQKDLAQATQTQRRP